MPIMCKTLTLRIDVLFVYLSIHKARSAMYMQFPFSDLLTQRNSPYLTNEFFNIKLIGVQRQNSTTKKQTMEP